MAYSYYRSVTIDESKCGTADSTDFPVTFTGTYAWLATVANGGEVQVVNGGIPDDVGFFSNSDLASGNKLDWEVVAYNGATGFIEVHFRVGTLSASTNGVIYCATGDSGISTFQGNVNGTWNGDYELVDHFGDGSTLSLTDSTSNANNGSQQGSPTAAAGAFGAGSMYSNSASDYSLVSGNPLNGFSAMTVQAVLKTGSNYYNGGVVALKNSDWGGAGTVWQLQSDGAATSKWSFYKAISYAGDGATADSGHSVGNWEWVAVTVDGSGNIVMYVNGVAQADTGTKTGTMNQTTNTGVGAGWGGSSYIYIDEARVSSVGRSASWMLAEYNNQSSPSTFYTIGSQTPVGGGAAGRSVFLSNNHAVTRAANY